MTEADDRIEVSFHKSGSMVVLVIMLYENLPQNFGRKNNKPLMHRSETWAGLREKGSSRLCVLSAGPPRGSRASWMS